MNRKYSVVIKLPINICLPHFQIGNPLLRGDNFIVEREIIADDRASAVRMATRYFWQKFAGSHLSPRACLTVDDPNNEVTYRDWHFNCSLPVNNYLTDDAIRCVEAESHGLVVRNTLCASSDASHPGLSLRRTKRYIGPWMQAIAPSIFRTSVGTLFYSIIIQQQKTTRGSVAQKSKVKLMKLAAKTIADAIEEIKVRKLVILHLDQAAHFRKRRSLELTAHLCELTTLSLDDQKYFASSIESYNRQRSLKEAASQETACQ